MRSILAQVFLITSGFCGFVSPQKYLIYAVLWSFSGDGRLKMRAELGEYIRRITTVPLPAAPNVPIIDYEVCLVVSLPF